MYHILPKRKYLNVRWIFLPPTFLHLDREVCRLALRPAPIAAMALCRTLLSCAVLFSCVGQTTSLQAGASALAHVSALAHASIHIAIRRRAGAMGRTQPPRL